MVAPGKINLPLETAGQVEVAARYFEGLAAGAVLLGEFPHSEKSRNYKDWTEGVIEIRSDGSDLAEVIQSLISDRERLEELSRRNIIHALLHHDWVYRWKQILKITGTKETDAMRIRERRLREMAALVQQSSAPVFTEPLPGRN